MTWRRYYKSRFLSSFLLWFAVLLISSYVLLFISVQLLIIKPHARIFADVLIMLNDAVVQVAEAEGNTGIDALKLRGAQRNALFQIVPNDNDAAQGASFWYPGFRFSQGFVSTQSGGDVSLRFNFEKNPTLFLSDKRHPDFAFQFEHKGAPFSKVFLALSLFIIVLTCAIAAWLIARRLTNPLWELAEQAKQLAVNKDLAAISFDEKKALPEIVTLTRALNDMRAELDRTIKDRELLLADVTHDLRTPLSRLHIALDILEPSNPGAVKTMLDDVAEMRTILEQFVELAKLNTELNEPWEEGDLNALVGRIRDQYRRAGVNLRTQLGNAPVVIAYKPIGLTRLLYNLVDNACRHGDGNIQISVTRDQGDVVLDVSNQMLGNDQGTGLTHAIAEGSGKTPTTGLGLRIVQNFAAAHRAELEESVSDGIKTFRLRFKPDQP